MKINKMKTNFINDYAGRVERAKAELKGMLLDKYIDLTSVRLV